jgi:hypothetical protein
MAYRYVDASFSGGGDGVSIPAYWIDDSTGAIRFSNPNATTENGWIHAPGASGPEGANTSESWWNPQTGQEVQNPYAGPRNVSELGTPGGPFANIQVSPGMAAGMGLLATADVPGQPDMAWRYANGQWYMGPRQTSHGGLRGVIDKGTDFIGDAFDNPIKAIAGTAGFGVGGVSGASAATGGGVTPQTLALDAAGLGAGYGLSGLIGSAGAAAGGTAPTAMTSAPSAVAGGTGLNASYAPTALGGTGASGLGVSAAYAPPALGGVGASSLGLDAGLAGAGWGAPAAGAGVLGGAANVPAPMTGGGAAGVGAGAGGAATTGGIAGILSNPMTIGALGGAALGGLSGTGTEAGTVTVEEGLPDWLMPYAKPQLDKYSTDLQNYQIDPYGVMPSAMQEFQKTIAGQYLDPSTNKYLEDYFRLGAERVKGSLSPSFGHMQAFGQHSGYNEALSRGLGDLAVGLYGGAYEKERDRQTQMTGLAPNFLTQSSTSAFAPYQQYLGTIGSLGKKKDQPYFEANPWSNVLGGAMTGAAFGNLFRSGR